MASRGRALQPDRQHASLASTGPAAFVDRKHQPGQRNARRTASNGGCVETARAEASTLRALHRTTSRAGQQTLCLRAVSSEPSARIRRRDERAGDTKCASDPPGFRKRLDDPALEIRHAANGPISGVFSGLRRDLIVRAAFNPEKAQDGRREAPTQSCPRANRTCCSQFS